MQILGRIFDEIVYSVILKRSEKPE